MRGSIRQAEKWSTLVDTRAACHPGESRIHEVNQPSASIPVFNHCCPARIAALRSRSSGLQMLQFTAEAQRTQRAAEVMADLEKNDSEFLGASAPSAPLR